MQSRPIVPLLLSLPLRMMATISASMSSMGQVAVGELGVYPTLKHDVWIAIQVAGRLRPVLSSLPAPVTRDEANIGPGAGRAGVGNSPEDWSVAPGLPLPKLKPGHLHVQTSGPLLR
jgi:hypothetical protein